MILCTLHPLLAPALAVCRPCASSVDCCVVYSSLFPSHPHTTHPVPPRSHLAITRSIVEGRRRRPRPRRVLRQRRGRCRRRGRSLRLRRGRRRRRPLPAGMGRIGSSAWLVHLERSRFSMKRKIYPIFSCGANKFARCIRNKVERRVFWAFPPSE